MTHTPDSQINHKNTGVTRIIKAAGYSAKGLRSAWSSEAAFRQECILAAVLLPIVFLLDTTNVERCLLVMVTILVLIVELLNSAIEAVVDRIGSEFHVLSGQAKDIGSAAVLISLFLCGYVWLEVVFF